MGRRPFEWDDGKFADSADVTHFRGLLDETLTTGAPRDFTRSQTGLDGRTQTYRVSFRAQRDDEHRIVGAFMFAQDMSDLDQARQQVMMREREFRSLAENLPDVVLRYDHEGALTYVNDAYERELELQRPPLGTTNVFVNGIGAGQADEFGRRLAAVLADGVPDQMELRIGRPTHDLRASDETAGCGSSAIDHADARVLSVAIRPERDESGRVIGALALARDVTLLVRTSQRAEASERRFRSLTENAQEFIGRWSPEGQRLYVNPALARLMGGSPQELVGQPSSGGPGGTFAGVTEAIRQCAVEATPRTLLHTHHDPQDGKRRVHEVQLVPEFDDAGRVVSVLGVGRDVTTVVRQREELERASRTDSLTGAANRRVLYDVLPAALAGAERAGRHVALLLADLDGFKHLNDQYGHTFGDRLLRAVAEALAACTERPPIRLGGDEFALLADVASAADAALLAHRIQIALSDLRHDGARFPPIDVSFGVAISPTDGSDPDVLLTAADLALHAAKRQGRARVEFYRPNLRTAAERRSAVEDALRSAVPDLEMELHLQPICELDASERVWGVEALLRWQHPVLGAVSPVEFISIAEQCGQIVPIGRWVLSRAAAIAIELNTGRTDPIYVCVNVSTRQFTLDDIVEAVVDALRSTACDPRWIALELTESLLLEDLPLVNNAITRLRELGVGIAIDDFGTGYSALHYLTKLRIDHMKIDKAFVHDVEADAQQQEVVRALIALATAIGVDVIAEGIETTAQAAFLRDLGCGLGQGYLLAKPLPQPDLMAWLAARGH